MDLRLWGPHGDTRQRLRRHGSQVMQRVAQPRPQERAEGATHSSLGHCITVSQGTLSHPQAVLLTLPDTCAKSHTSQLCHCHSGALGPQLSVAINLYLCSVRRLYLCALEGWVTVIQAWLYCYAATYLGFMAALCGLSLFLGCMSSSIAM